jgi:hypothetical protein
MRRMVVCDFGTCQEWAVSFLSSADAPEHAPLEQDFDLDSPPPPKPLWYACASHSTDQHKSLDGLVLPPVCDRCGSAEGVQWEDGRSAYHVDETVWHQLLVNIDEEPPDPNRAMPYCRDCAEDWHRYWDEMWSYANTY